MFRSRSWSVRWVAGICLLTMLVGVGAWSRGPVDGVDARERAGVVAEVALPVQAQEVLRQVYRGGPFRYEKDGSTFFNRERLLPRRKRGHYREYTVPTPGLNHRGARRIVCGGEQPRAPEACYYTADHYASFRKIVQ